MTPLEDSFRRQCGMLIGGMPFALPIIVITFLLTLGF
jgi:hypothetical protein